MDKNLWRLLNFLKTKCKTPKRKLLKRPIAFEGTRYLWGIFSLLKSYLTLYR